MTTANTANTAPATTAKNFNGKWANFLKTAKSQRDQLQAFVQFAAEEYATKTDKNGDLVQDSGRLTRILLDSVAVRSFATGTLKEYIEAHTNLKWTAKKGEDARFTKVKGSEFKCDLEAFASTVWYLHNSEGQAKPTFKAEDYAKRVAQKLVVEGLSADDFMQLVKAAEKEARAAKAKKAKETLSAAA